MGLKSVLGKIVKAPVKGVKRAAIGSAMLGLLAALDQAFGLGLGQDVLQMIADIVANLVASM